MSSTEVKRYRFKGAAGEYVYSVDFDKAQAEINGLKNDLASANSDKEAYGQNAIDLRRRLGKAIVLLQETSMPQARIDQILIS